MVIFILLQPLWQSAQLFAVDPHPAQMQGPFAVFADAGEFDKSDFTAGHVDPRMKPGDRNLKCRRGTAADEDIVPFRAVQGDGNLKRAGRPPARAVVDLDQGGGLGRSEIDRGPGFGFPFSLYRGLVGFR